MINIPVHKENNKPKNNETSKIAGYAIHMKGSEFSIKDCSVIWAENSGLLSTIWAYDSCKALTLKSGSIKFVSK